jgi:hypothetical protein
MPIQRLKKTDSNNYLDIDYNELSNELSINTDERVEKPPICMQIRQGAELFRFGTFGNFSVIGGKGKARKTFFISAILGSAISDSTILNIKSTFGAKKIVYFDTEQSEYDLHWSAKRAIQLNNETYHPDNYDVFCLRPLDPPGRVAFIENYLEKNENVGLMVIDGVRDLLVDINSPDQSTEITTKIMQWTKSYHLHACLVLHQNPGSDKLRGHIGTEITNKAETYVSIEVPSEKKDISIIIPKAMRGTKPFDEYAFKISDDILPVLAESIDLPF